MHPIRLLGLLLAAVAGLARADPPRSETSGALPPTLPPSRQVHLDFHTSEHIPDVGARWSKSNWQQALRLGRVNWINLFAKCHHGWSYYPTQIGRMHPTLGFDLMGEQIKAGHEIGVRCPLYFTVGWSVQDAERHPDWCVRLQDGSIASRSVDFTARPGDPRPTTSWVFLCPTGDYLDLILRQTAELCERYPVDGFFYDIDAVSPPCFCVRCRDSMAAEGISPDDEAAVAAHEARKWKKFFASARAVIAQRHPEATVFFNGTTKLQPHCTNFELWSDNTQMELEDLPTTWGGYDKFALRSKFFHLTGKPVFAMSGKFHTFWGEFGGFKHRDAMRYEAASMIAFGASCNFGDQLHPSGEMDLETYRRLGFAYEYAEQIEAYGVGGRPVSRLGLWRTSSPFDDEGVSNLLMETQNDYEVVDPVGNLDRFDTIVVTGAAGMTDAQASRLNAFARRGGGLLVLGDSALDAGKSRFLLEVGARYVGPANYEIDYTVLGKPMLTQPAANSRESGSDLVATPFLNYRAALRCEPLAGTEVLATIREPYFDRTYGRYSSHQNTPFRLEEAPHPAALRHDRVVFLPHRLGEMYYTNGARLHRDLFETALGLVYRNPMVRTELPSAGRVSLLHQPNERRYVAHLLYAPPLQRGRTLVIEDLPELREVPIEVRLPERVKRAYLIPGRKALSLRRVDGAVRVTIPRFRMHCGAVFEY